MGEQKAPMYDQYASLGKNSHYGRIYEDTIKSQPYKNLTLAEKNLYTKGCSRQQSLVWNRIDLGKQRGRSHI